MLKKLYKKMKPYLTPKMIIVFGSVWIITTGWVHAFVIIGSVYKISWLLKLGLTIEVIIWNPFVNEKLITIPFSIWIYKKIFKEDILEIKKEIEE